MKKLLIATLCAVPLAAFAQSAGDEIDGGNWEFGMEIDHVDGSGVPPDVLTSVERQIEDGRKTQCVSDGGPTQLQSLRDGFIRGLAQGGSGDMNCQFAQSDRVGGGTFQVNATCSSATQPVTMKLGINGGYTRTTLDADVDMNVNASGPGGGPGATIQLRGKLKGRRLGSCR